MNDIVDHLTREQRAIAIKWADGASTPTPPGHWNFIAEPYIAAGELERGARRARVRAAQHDAARRRRRLLGREVRRTSTRVRAARSRDQDGDRPAELPVVHVRPLDVLGGGRRSADLSLSQRPRRLRTSRDEAAISRLYGGIHYRTDNEVGEVHGKAIGGYTVRFALPTARTSPLSCRLQHTRGGDLLATVTVQAEYRHGGCREEGHTALGSDLHILIYSYCATAFAQEQGREARGGEAARGGRPAEVGGGHMPPRGPALRASARKAAPAPAPARAQQAPPARDGNTTSPRTGTAILRCRTST